MEVMIAVAIISMSVIHIINLIVSHKKMEQELFFQSSKYYEAEKLIYCWQEDMEENKVQLETEAVDIEIDDCVFQMQSLRVTVSSSNGRDRIYLMIGRGEDS